LNIDTIILGGGCFWCIEALFKELDGIIKMFQDILGVIQKILLTKKFAQEIQVMQRYVKLNMIKIKFLLNQY
jgi:hypothetical protein